MTFLAALSLLLSVCHAQNVVDGWLQWVGPIKVERIDNVARTMSLPRHTYPVNKFLLHSKTKKTNCFATLC